MGAALRAEPLITVDKRSQLQQRRCRVRGVEILLHDDVEEFARLALPLLGADPIRYTVELTVTDALCRSGEPATALLTVHEAGEVVGAAMRTPGYPALVSALPPVHAAPVEEAFAAADPNLRGASGRTPEVEAFAAAHVARTGARVRPEQRMRLFTLDELVPPVGVRGDARRADERDADLLGEWRRAFAEDDRGAWTSSQSPREVAVRSLQVGNCEMVWEVEGAPVAQASAHPVVAGMSRIGPVYTPPQHRRHGYAAAVTAEASQWALDEGAQQVLLFTDLANPTTNRLYPRIGYRPVYDALELRFTS
jgi:GNAT superfamily N-acetyltransferase